ncbi:TetR/AcrR family transcriptional regulator [Rhizohabitans arisaemae]|uniref:TetR/AcrR family transcriptional regulator n=1 Tax=Rhizohabitans arisaemae TaxID=2720610 RepID=UPI0024B21739|nr:TetR/AcrR family transcriptional regulator [Rhizohabitans arisaemae]
MRRSIPASIVNQVVGGKKRETSNIRSDELVQAGFRRVAEVGFEGLRLRQVADEVGIDHSTLHHYFATKQDLIDAIAAYTTRQFWLTSPENPDPAARLRGHLDTLRTMMRERPDLFIVTIELDLRARRDPAVREAMRGHEEGWREALVEILTDGVQAGVWAPGVEAEAGAELIMTAVKGARLNPEQAETIFNQLMKLLSAPREDQCM